ncbi:putative HTH-type transcriptional regulator YdfH [Roseovarius albus]|uniref:Putative HTH-type transcriptional regulator YdfH n=1 Tax=Roseovarius albus TaxID=1247867 RepID=A0A1X6ZQE9_9RHOB|nr:GntR family transcriptional regulator [Roseovarius albus]SLN58126.1 putative HTH-type transcriptional regulator YdfH [Roseovarius albus]
MNVIEADSVSLDDETGAERFDRIYCELRDRICLLTYPPGTVLSETKLAKEFGISRTPIRRVFHRLEFMGLVQIKNGVGTMVTDIDLKTFKQIYDLRKRLAEMMGELSPVEITSEHIETIDGLIERAQALADHKGAFDELARIANDLQRLLSDLTGNAPLREMIELMYYRVARIWYTFLPQFGWDKAHSGQLNELGEIRAAMVDSDIRSVGHYRSIDLQRMLTQLGRLLVEP